MTITARRVLTAIVAVGMLGIGSAFATGNTLPYTNDFEVVPSPTALATNMLNWSSTTDDQSAVTNLIYSYSGTLPTWPTGTNRVLQLNTQGAVLTNKFDTVSMATTVTYMDTMVQFVPSDTTPTLCTTNSSGIKLAIFANSATNLAIYHGIRATSYGNLVSNTVEDTGKLLTTGQWYRLTVVFDATAVDPNTIGAVEMFQVKLDGVLITNAVNAYADGTPTPPWKSQYNSNGTLPASGEGTWFGSAEKSDDPNPKALNSIAFQGTGYIDDLKVSTSDPFDLGATTFSMIVTKSGANAAHGTASFLGTTSVPISTGTQVVYTAYDFYRIDTVLKDGAAVQGPNAGVKMWTQTVTSAGATVSNDVSFAQATYSQVGGSYVTNSSLLSWAKQTWSTESDAAGDSNILTDWMLAQPATATYTAALAVKSIAVTDSTNVSVVVTLSGVASTNVTINGTLRLEGSTDLSAWAPIGTATVGPGTAAFNVNGDSAPINFVSTNEFNFFKAEILP